MAGQAFPAALEPDFPIVGTEEGTFEWHDVIGDTWTSSEWDMTLHGILAGKTPLSAGTLFVVEYASASSGPFVVFCCGFVESCVLEDTGEHAETWEITLRSVAYILGNEHSKPLRVGNVNAALGAEASSNPPLASPWKERFSGDNPGANPDNSAAAAVDGDLGTGWIGDGIQGDPFDNLAGHSGFSMLFLAPPFDAPGGLRFIEMVNDSWGSSTLNVWDTTLHQGFVTETGAPADFNAQYADRAIFAESLPTFSREFPSAQPVKTWDLSTSNDQTTREFLRHCRPVVGQLARVSGGTARARVTWGDWAGYVAANPGISWPSWVDTSATSDIPEGNTVGHCMRWRMEDGLGWVATPVVSPSDYPDNDANTGDDSWIYIKLPGPGLRVRDELTGTAPPDNWLALTDAAGNLSSEGLPLSGEVVIADNIYPYDTRGPNAIHVTGVTGPTPWVHAAGTAVYLRYADPLVQGGYYASDTFVISRIRLRRRANIRFLPYHYRLYVSGRQARTPTESRHEDDYDLQTTYTNAMVLQADGSWLHEIVFTPPRVIKTFGIQFGALDDLQDVYGEIRPRFDEIEAIVDPATFLQGAAVASGTEADAVAVTFLQQCTSLPDGCAVNMGEVSQAAAQAVSEDGPAWGVLTDFAQYANVFVRARADGKVGVYGGNYWTTGETGSPAATWDEDDYASIRFDRRITSAITQAQLDWRLPGGAQGGTVVYPTNPTHTGQVLSVPSAIYANQAAALAAVQAAYYQAVYPYQVYVELVTGTLALRTGQQARVSHKWQSTGQVETCDFLITQLDHYVADGNLVTVVAGAEMNRSVP